MHVLMSSVGTWEILVELTVMFNDKIKKDNFETNLILRKEVRSTHSSVESG